MRSQSFVGRSRLRRSFQALLVHSSLICFAALLVAKISSQIALSWWWIFVPLWVFHAIVARGRFSLPAPCAPHDRHWAPCHAVVAIPLLLAFEVLVCTYLDIHNDDANSTFSLKIVFLPILILESIILIDNFRMCKALMPGDEESMTDEAIWETLPHFWVAVSMVFFIAATVFTLLKLSGDIQALGWWDLFINFWVAEGFAFLVCTKWSNPLIQEEGLPLCRSERVYMRQGSTSTPSEGEANEEVDEGFCGLENIGGHFMKVPVILFQILLCMKLEGTPKQVENIPVVVVFVPIFFFQGVIICFYFVKVVENLMLLVKSNDNGIREEVFPHFSHVKEFCGFLDHGSRLFGWWSIDGCRSEERACLGGTNTLEYNTFAGLPPEVVRKLPRKDLTEEVWRLQGALEEQFERTKVQQEAFNRLQNVNMRVQICLTSNFYPTSFVMMIQVVFHPSKLLHNYSSSSASEGGFYIMFQVVFFLLERGYVWLPSQEKVLCRVCFERDITIVLLPCKHRVLCTLCSERCKSCPVCRVHIVERMQVYDV